MYLWICLIICIVCQLTLANKFTPSCYYCPNRSAFPECLNFLEHCAHNEVCEVVYGTFESRIGCMPAHECKHDVHHAHTRCGNGGHFVHHQCEICCADNDCVTQQLAAIYGTLANATTGSTTSQPTTGTNQTPATATVATTVSTTSGTSTMWQYNPCADQMINNECVGLMSVMCNSVDGVSMCAHTCGFCDLLVSTFNRHIVCEDELVGDECTLFKETRDICNNPLAQFTCSKTCKLCDAIVGNLTKQLLSGELTTKSVTTTQSSMGETTTVQAVKFTTDKWTTQDFTTDTWTTQDFTTDTWTTQDVTTDKWTTQDFNTDKTTTTQDMTTKSTTTKLPEIVTMTQVATQQTTTDQCVDQLENGQCTTLLNVCTNGPHLCPKFCGLCGVPTGMTGSTSTKNSMA